jgi:hypothetical protein
MKFNLKDELDLLLQLRNENFGQDLPEPKPNDESQSRLLAKKALDRLHAFNPPVLETPSNFSPGQVWQTCVLDRDFPSGPFGPRTFILTNIIKEGDVCEIMGIPVSENWRFAAPQDLVVGPGGGMPALYDEWVMIELHWETFLPEGALSRFVGEVTDELFARIQSLLTWMDGEEVERAFMGVEYAKAENKAVLGPPLEKWNIKDPVTGEMHSVLMGQQIVGKDDPRLEYKKLSLEDLNYLVLPMLNREPEEDEVTIEPPLPPKDNYRRLVEHFKQDVPQFLYQLEHQSITEAQQHRGGLINIVCGIGMPSSWFLMMDTISRLLGKLLEEGASNSGTLKHFQDAFSNISSLQELYGLMISIIEGKYYDSPFTDKLIQATGVGKDCFVNILLNYSREVIKSIKAQGEVAKASWKLLRALLWYRLGNWLSSEEAFTDLASFPEYLDMSIKANIWLYSRRLFMEDKAKERAADIFPDDVVSRNTIISDAGTVSLESFTGLGDVDDQIASLYSTLLIKAA